MSCAQEFFFLTWKNIKAFLFLNQGIQEQDDVVFEIHGFDFSLPCTIILSSLLPHTESPRVSVMSLS